MKALNITCYTEKAHKLEFAAIMDGETTEADLQSAINAYIDFHLAIRPNVNVIIFFIDAYTPTGTRLYKKRDTTPELYHIPPSRYDEIGDHVIPNLFVVSTSLLVKCIETKQLTRNIFEWIEEHQKEHGLIVLGIHSENQKEI